MICWLLVNLTREIRETRVSASMCSKSNVLRDWWLAAIIANDKILYSTVV